MSKDKQNIEQTEDVVEAVTAVEQETNSSKQEFVENSEKETASQADKEDTKVEQKAEGKTVVVQKSGGKGIALLALLVAIAVGGAGHYLANQKFTDVEQQIAKLAGQQPVSSPQIEIPNFDAEKAQIAELGSSYQKALERIGQLEQEQSNYLSQINGLKTQLQKVSGVPQSESVVWKLSDADFLLNNALRKLVLDNDIDTAKSLLSEADSVLSQVSNTDVANVRSAIKSDLSQLANVNNVDQNSLMQRLTALANRLDDLPMIANEAIEDTVMESGEVSDSIEDWQKKY